MNPTPFRGVSLQGCLPSGVSPFRGVSLRGVSLRGVSPD